MILANNGNPVVVMEDSMQSPPPAELPDALSIKDVERRANVGHTKVFAEIKEGRLKARKIGRRTIVLASDFAAWLESLPEVNAAAASPKTREAA